MLRTSAESNHLLAKGDVFLMRRFVFLYFYTVELSRRSIRQLGSSMKLQAVKIIGSEKYRHYATCDKKGVEEGGRVLLQDLNVISYCFHRRAKSQAWPPGRASPGRRALPTGVCPPAGRAALHLHRPLRPRPPRPRPSPSYQQCPHRSRPSPMPPSTPRRSSSDPNQKQIITQTEQRALQKLSVRLFSLPTFVYKAKQRLLLQHYGNDSFWSISVSNSAVLPDMTFVSFYKKKNVFKELLVYFFVFFEIISCFLFILFTKGL